MINTNNVAQIIERLGGTLKVAVAVNVHQVTVERWRRRNAIPRKYLAALGVATQYKKTK
jgi:hypothetical protein